MRLLIYMMPQYGICISLCLPGVILNPVRDDLRMMALKPVAERDGAMKDYAEGCRCNRIGIGGKSKHRRGFGLI